MSREKRKLSGADIFFEGLKRENVEFIFGYPGGATLKIYEKLYDITGIRHVLSRHEQGAVHMAEGYAKATGKTGVVLVTSGPGATNTVTGIANAFMDSSPLVVFTGQVSSQLIGNDAFQEADIVGITRPITKHSFLVRNVEDFARIIRKAFYIASTGRPGPVVVDLPKDMIAAETAYDPSDNEVIDIRGYKPSMTGHINQIRKAAKIINEAKRPLLYVGGGVIGSNGAQELRDLAIKANIPVTMTLQGLGAFPGTHPLSMGMLGMHGMYWANQAVNSCDVLVALGARFDDRVTGKVDTFARDAYKIHVDIDPAAINKNVIIDLPIVGDVRGIMADMLPFLQENRPRTEWLEQIQKWREACPLNYEEDGSLRSEYIIEKLSEKTKGEAIIVSDVGQNQMWTAQYYKFVHPRSLLSSGGLGTMGFSVPASIGAAFGKPGSTVISISGDGGFQMNIQELITAVYYKLPVKFVILNNSFLGMVRQWQELFHAEKYSFTDLGPSNPDFVKVAEALGIPAFSADTPDAADSLLDKGLAMNDGPVLMEFKVVKEDMVYPMVPAGASISDMLTRVQK